MLVDPFRPEAGRIRAGDLFAMRDAQPDCDSPCVGRKLLDRQAIWNGPLVEAAPQTEHLGA